MNLITAVIPTNNFKSYENNFRQLLTSLQNLQIEVILVLDSEDDETHKRVNAILDEFKTVSIKVVSGFFGSPGLARNAGMNIASSEWLAFWDFDDHIFPQRWIDMCNQAAGHELAIGSYEVLDISDGSIYSHVIDEPEFPRAVALSPGIWRMLFWKKSLLDLQFSNYKMGEDQLFLAQYKFYEKKTYLHQEIVYRYVKGNLNQATSNQKLMTDLLDVNLIIKSICKSSTPFGTSVLNTVYVRQLCTLIVRGEMSIKVISAIRLAKLFFSRESQTMAIKTMVEIVRQK